MKTKWLAIGIILLFVGTCITPTIAQDTEKPLPASRGTWLYVGGSGPGNYTKIQDAINDSSDGDTVFVFSGTYYERLILNTSINLIGEDKHSTIIKSNESYYGGDKHIATVFASGVTISGFRIQNGEDGIEINRFGFPNTSHSNNISGNIFEGCGGCAVRVVDSNNNTISNNIINNTDNGGLDIGGNDNIISGNKITNLIWYAIRIIHDPQGNLVTNNNISNCVSGIQLQYCNNNTISKNILVDCLYGLIFQQSRDNIISDNSFLNSGLFVFEDALYNTVSNNTVNGKSLLYLEFKSNQVIDEDAGQIIVVHCNNISVKNQDISNTTVGVQLLISDNCSITENTLTANLYGLFIQSSFNNVISENNISENKYHGITFISCYDSIISRNILKGNNQLYFLFDVLFVFFGYNSSAGIFIVDSFRNTIMENSIYSNNYNGISLILSGRNIISNNSLRLNNHTGLLLFGSLFNRIYNNTFLDNKNDAFFNMCFCNRWKGNYWNEARRLPKLIHGKLLFRSWINIDWHPAQEPYDIPRMS
ncbi:MAG TPA: NosD domain-containing protein [Candidatus Thermoplasmatota archaeon]|nr:NosD domain-containing protein [Candidatus Thermoplasmatota archaeon]